MEKYKEFIEQVREMVENYSFFLNLAEKNFEDGTITEDEFYKAINYRAGTLHESIVNNNPIHGKGWRK